MNEKEVHIIGTGSDLPPFEATNAEICKFYPQRDPAWIEAKTGIEKRRIGFDLSSNTMRPEYSDGEMARRAAERALQAAGIKGSDLDLIVRVTCTPDYLAFPDSACVLHQQIRASKDCAAYTMPSGCGGLIYAIRSVVSQMKGDGIKLALIVASNAPSSYMELTNPDWCRKNCLNAYIFGDGASAVVLKVTDPDPHSITRGVCNSYWGAWHERDPIRFEAGGSKNPTRPQNVWDHYFNMDAKAVVDEAPKHFMHCIGQIVKKTGIDLHNIDFFLFHQANLRIIEGMCLKLGLPKAKVLTHLERYGNTSAASIGILLDEAVRSGLILPGKLVLMVGVGAGWQYGALLLRW